MEFVKDNPTCRSFLNNSTKIMMKLFRVKVHVKGMEKIPVNEKLFFVSNHVSCYDPIISWYVFRDWKISFISKPENFKVPIYGRIIRKCLFLPIDRKNPKNAIRTIYKASDFLKKEEVSVGVYPEGTRSKKGRLLDFHNGVFKIAQKSSKPTVVLTITGTEKIYKRLIFRKTHVYIDVAKVVYPDEYVGKTSEALGNDIKGLMQDSLKKMKEENRN